MIHPDEIGEAKALSDEIVRRIGFKKLESLVETNPDARRRILEAAFFNLHFHRQDEIYLGQEQHRG